MLQITRKLKRVAIVWWILSLPLFIITLPLSLLARLGVLCDDIVGYVAYLRDKAIGFYVMIFNLNEVAKKQYAENTDKFKFK